MNLSDTQLRPALLQAHRHVPIENRTLEVTGALSRLRLIDCNGDLAEAGVELLNLLMEREQQ